MTVVHSSITSIAAIVLLASCSTFQDDYSINLTWDDIQKFDYVKFKVDDKACREVSDNKTTGPLVGLLAASNPGAVVIVALAGAIHTRYASNLTNKMYVKCMESRGYRVHLASQVAMRED